MPLWNRDGGWRGRENHEHGCTTSSQARWLQHVFEDACLDFQLAPEHRARHIWAFVEKADTGPLEVTIRSRTGGAGALAIAPRLLLALRFLLALRLSI